MNPSPRAAAFLNKLRGVKNKANGDGWMAFCPAHDDGHERALSISEANGKVLLRCFAGCSAENVITSVGLTMADLFEDGLQVAALPVSGRPVSRFTLPDGSVAEHWRLDGPEGKRMWWTRAGRTGLDGYKVSDIPLYLANELSRDAVLVVEGEKAADAARTHAAACGYDVAATTCGAATIPSDTVLRVLVGRYVALWPDNDAPGRTHMSRIAHRLTLMGEWPFMVASLDLPPKGDAADFDGDLGERLGDAMPWGELPSLKIPSDSNNYRGIRIDG